MSAEPLFRRSVRALILDEADRVLLVNFDWPGLGIDGGFWACPGGGVEAGEDEAAALCRELAEEVGLDEFVRGPVLWTKRDEWPFGRFDGQLDAVYLVRTRHFTPAPRLTAEELADENVHGWRWFEAHEIVAGVVTFSPRSLPSLVADLLSSGVPARPVSLVGH